MRVFAANTWDNRNDPRSATNATEGLTTRTLIRSDPNGCK